MAVLGATLWGHAGAQDAAAEPGRAGELEWRASAEAGYRTLDVEGNEDLYRSHANLGEGFRLFDLSLEAIPREADGGFFDALRLDASGIGGDPQQWAHFSLRKRGVYRWDIKYNRSNYFFDVPDFVLLGQHTNDNTRRTLDSLLEFTLGGSRVYAGFSRQEFDGPAFVTQHVPDLDDEFLLSAPAARDTNDTRLGVDFGIARWRFNLEAIYRSVDSSSVFTLDPGSGQGNNPGNNSDLTAFFRSAPLSGTYWISRGSAQASFGERADLAIRLVHTRGEVVGSATQSSEATTFGFPFTESVNADFATHFPSDMAEAGMTIRLAPPVSLHLVLRYVDWEIDGSSEEVTTQDFGGSPFSFGEMRDGLTRWTSWEGRTEVEWRVHPAWVLRGGYGRVDRDVTTVSLVDGLPDEAEGGNQVAETFFGSVGFRHASRWSALLELSDGRTDNVFLRVDAESYRLARLRVRYRTGERWSVGVSGSYRDADNPDPSVDKSFVARTAAASMDYNGPKLVFSAGYSAVNLDSSTDIVFCAGTPCTTAAGTLVADVSRWMLTDNHYFLDATYKFTGRVHGAFRGQMTDSQGTFPVDFYSAEPRISVQLHDGLWLSAAWYRYEFDRAEDDLQDYRAEGARLSLKATF